LISCEIGYEKPDPRAFQFLLEELDLPPNLCTFIDDKKENVEAARALGEV
jgi:HAD superfamily hydrolase (TIGR01509 family)